MCWHLCSRNVRFKGKEQHWYLVAEVNFNRKKNSFIRPVISQDFFYKSPIASEFSWKKRSSHQGKKEVACTVSKPLVSCLWGMWRVCKSSKINHPRGSRGFEGGPRHATHFTGSLVVHNLDSKKVHFTLYFCWRFFIIYEWDKRWWQQHYKTSD